MQLLALAQRLAEGDRSVEGLIDVGALQLAARVDREALIGRLVDASRVVKLEPEAQPVQAGVTPLAEGGRRALFEQGAIRLRAGGGLSGRRGVETGRRRPGILAEHAQLNRVRANRR